MDKYVVLRDLAERLKSAGYPQIDTVHVWFKTVTEVESWEVWRREASMGVLRYTIAAPLSDELLEQLPSSVMRRTPKMLRNESLKFFKQNTEHTYTVGYTGIRYFAANKPADALAALWLWCKEQGYIK